LYRYDSKKNGPWRTEGMFFGSLWNLSIFDGINQKKDKKKKDDRYVLLFDESLNQQLKKTSWTYKIY
jgi:hypothetical protein